jgi:prolyl-tRNA editing enzyme YbaK/EbsC (Cys-tRNA(Pro) deacylase)
LRVADEVILIVTRGDARLDNKKYKARFSTKARMLGFDEVEEETGHPVGGVCPFGLAKPHKVYCDAPVRHHGPLPPAPRWRCFAGVQ